MKTESQIRIDSTDKYDQTGIAKP